MLAMTDEHEDDRKDAVARPETIKAKVTVPTPTIVTGKATLTMTYTGTARGEVTKPALTTIGVETEHARTIRYSVRDEDGVRYVEVVDGKGEHVASGVGDAADALWDLLLYLLPPDHPEFPTD